MANTKIIQRRIRSVKNAKQITKALEVVAASRMRRVVDVAPRSRAYGDLAAEIMQRLTHNQETKQHPFFAPASDLPTLPTGRQAGQAGRPALYIVITSDRGQAGAFNSNIFNLAISQIRIEKHRPQVVAIGRKGARFFANLSGIDFKGAYENIADIPDVNVFSPLVEMIEESMHTGSIWSVKLIYTQFISSLSQKAASFSLLPIDLSQAQADEAEKNQPVREKSEMVYELEPDVGDVLEEAIKLYFEAKLMQARVESAASEHAMRMVAMGNANRNASDLIDDLTLELNATRQAAITQEIAEITGGGEAIAK